MKKRIAGIFFALVCLTFLFPVYAQESAAFSIVRKHLLAGESDTSMLSNSEISEMISELAQNGYDVTFSIDEEKAYRYDAALDILEEILGDYYSWTIEEKNLFDQIMVECGELSYCHNLLPGDEEISQEDAQRLALKEIGDQFNLDQSLLERPTAIFVSYYISEHSARKGMWRFGVDFENQRCFDVLVTEGSVTQCKESFAIDDLEKEYNLLCDQRGGFFKWSLQEKMEFADSLPQKLAKAKEKNALLMSDLELKAIASYGFCLPTDEVIPQAEAYAAASAAMEDEFHIDENSCAETYYSFFYQKDVGYVWRVIFWNTGNTEYTSVIVDLQAITGDILSIKSNGKTASEYIPYIERL